MISRRFLAFVIAGGIAAVANFGARIVLSLWLSYVPAIVLAFCIGMLTAFLLNRRFVFQSPTNALHDQAFWFVVVNLAAVVQTLAISLALAWWAFPAIDFDWHPETVAHAIGVIVPVVSSYFGHRALSFRGSGVRAGEPPA